MTGGANGIGLAIARVLAECGASVSILDLEREKPAEIAASVGARGIATDVTDRASIDAAFARCGPPDILMVNAGIATFGPMDETSAEDWNRTLAVNLSGAFHTIQAAAALMKPRRGGSIVITASTNSFDGEADLIAYNATKAGLLGILHTAANELGPYGIRVNAVCPGLIRTRLTAGHFEQTGLIREYFRHIPLGRGGEPEEVAYAAVFLASGLASFITGAALPVDGGQMAAKFGVWNEANAEFRDGCWRLK